MSKIKEIHIKNFKFFPDDIPPLTLKDGSEHVLLYGENGSGKSTLNWALFTLLESANKDDSSNIVKYFDERDPQNLLNIHSSSRGTEAFVKATLDDGTVWEISGSSSAINRDRDAQNSNLASDFINYRMLYRLLDFRNSQEIDLFPLFEAEVFDYLNFDDVITTIATAGGEININKVWRQILAGPAKVLVSNSATTEEYPVTGPTATLLKNGIDKFTRDLRQIIDELNPKANEILKKEDGLGINLDFKIELVEDAPFVLKQNQYNPPKYRIDLKIEKVSGIPVSVTTNIKPHIFLNEARLTAIGLAIRLSILEKRLAVAKLKLLVLDDLLISLDMSNRMKVVNMMLKSYCQRYQVFMMTHDRNFYELVKFRIEQEGDRNKWNFWEAYVNQEGTFEKPFFQFNQSSLSRAEALFHKFDYPAAGNYLRKAIEEFVDKWLPIWLRFDNKTFKEHDLSKKLSIGKKFLKDSGINSQFINDMDLFRKFILNASSHASYDTPIFKPELLNCIDALKADTPKLRFHKILEKNDRLNLNFSDRARNNFEIEITVFDMYLLKWDGDDSELSTFIGKIQETRNGVKGSPKYDEFNLKSLYTSYLARSAPPLNTDFWEEVKLDDGQLFKSKRIF